MIWQFPYRRLCSGQVIGIVLRMDIDINQLPDILRRRWIYPAAATALCGVLALGFAFSQTPTYRATVELIVDPAGFQNPTTTTTGAAGGAADQMATDSQLYVMQSAEVLGSVVDALNLQNDSWLAPPKSGGMLSRIFGSKTFSEEERKQEAINSLRSDISVIRADQSLVFAISAKHPVAKTAAQIANATADAYLEQTDKGRSGSARRASVSLKGQADELGGKLRKAQAEVEAYKAAHGLYSTPTKGLVADQQLEDISQQLAAARTRVEQQRTIYEQAAKLSMADIETGAIPEALQSSALVSLRTRYAQLLDAQAQLAANLGDQHPQLKAARSQVASMRSSIMAELERIRASLKNNYRRAVTDRDALQARYVDLRKATVDTSDARTRLAQLESEADALKAMYQSTLTKAEDLGGQPALDPTSARVISAAVTPGKPAGISKLLTLIAGMLFGLAAGSALAVLHEIIGRAMFAGPARNQAPASSATPDVPPPGAPTPRTMPDGPADMDIVGPAPITRVRRSGPVITTSIVAKKSEAQRAADAIRKSVEGNTAASFDIVFYPTSGVENTDRVIRDIAEQLTDAGAVVLISNGVETVAVARPLIVRHGPRVALAAPAAPEEDTLLFRPSSGTSLIRQADRGPVIRLANGAGGAAIAMLPGVIDHADATYIVVGTTTPLEEVEDLVDSLSHWKGKLIGAVIEEGAV
jgi:polysaccharide biosynthesis transport protein